MTRRCQACLLACGDTVRRRERNSEDTAVSVGRPRLELRPARKRALERLAFRIGRLTVELAGARAELAAAARAARSEGASIRAIAEAVDLSRPRVHELLVDAHRPMQKVSVDGGTGCG